MVPVVELTRRNAALAAEFHDAVTEVLASGIVLLGPHTLALEHELGAQFGGDHAVAVSSGASAIQLALAGLGIGPGDEVLVPAFTAVPTAAAVCALGATPVFVDVDPLTASVPGDAWDRERTARTKAVVVVHLYGRPAEQPQTDLPIVHDAAQAHGALPAHVRGVATAYSFYPTKNLGGIGDGGAVLTDDPQLAEHVRRLRVHGMTEQYVHPERSQNFRMSELEAAWLRLGLRRLAAWTERRRSVAATYRRAAPQLCWHHDHEQHVHHLAVFRSTRRDEVRAQLGERGVGTGVHYPLALTQQPGYVDLARSACPNAEAWAAECISVPCFPELTDDEIVAVAAALADLPGSP